MMGFVRRLKFSMYWFVAVVLMSIAAASSAQATQKPGKQDVLVMRSNQPGITAPVAFAPDDKLKIDIGREILIALPTGATTTVQGPFDGHAKDLKGYRASAGRGIVVAIWDFIINGGTKPIVVSTRNIEPDLYLGGEALFLPRTGRMTLCLGRSDSYKFRRVKADSKASIKIIPAGSTGEKELLMAKGTREAEWPSEYPFISGRVFQIKWPGTSLISVKFKLLAPSSLRGENRLSSLVANGCKVQAARWLAEQRAALK